MIPGSELVEVEPNRAVLDWKAYYDNFCKVHGEPIPVELEDVDAKFPVYTRVLFPDGWRYATTSYQGPEIPPPEDEKKLTQLKIQYWTERRLRDWKEAEGLKVHIQALEEWGLQRSLRLFEKVRYRDTDNKLRMESAELNLRGMRRRLEGLQARVLECDRKLASLSNV